MADPENLLTSEAIQMLIASVTDNGKAQLSEIEVERFLNALTRAQSGVPTAVSTNKRDQR